MDVTEEMSELAGLMRQRLTELLEAHGLPVGEHREWLVVRGQLPGLRCHLGDPRVLERGVSIVAHVELVLQDGRILCESFGGIGDGELEAVRDAFENFARSSFHVFLAGFWGVVDPDQVTVEKWQIAGVDWSVFIGNYTVRGRPVTIPESAFPEIEALLKARSLEGDLHWVRTFYCNTGTGSTTTEALLDNEEWPEAQAALGRLGWVPSPSFYSVRNFLVMQRRPAEHVDRPTRK